MSVDDAVLIKCAETAFKQLLVSVHTQQHLLDVPDRVLRRLEFLFPANVEEQQAALYWMGEQGDEDDAVLLASIPPANILCSTSLYELIRRKLLARVGHSHAGLQEPVLSDYLMRVTAELLPKVRDSLQELLDASQLGSNQWLDSDTASLLTLQQEADIALRDLQFLFPASMQDYEATLRWFKESGTITELGLLFAVPPPIGSSNEIQWLYQAAQDEILERLINNAAPISRDDGFHELTMFGIALRPVLGPRGSITEAAERRISARSAAQLLKAVARPGVDRNNLVMVLGEWGGQEDVEALGELLDQRLPTNADDEDFAVYLASALSNLGGSDVVEGLLQAAERGSERVRLAALSGLESLATAGAVALTEYPEPATIDNEEMRDAYIRLAERLSTLISTSTTPAYVRHKARELLDTVRISLNSA